MYTVIFCLLKYFDRLLAIALIGAISMSVSLIWLGTTVYKMKFENEKQLLQCFLELPLQEHLQEYHGSSFQKTKQLKTYLLCNNCCGEIVTCILPFVNK